MQVASKAAKAHLEVKEERKVLEAGAEGGSGRDWSALVHSLNMSSLY